MPGASSHNRGTGTVPAWGMLTGGAVTAVSVAVVRDPGYSTGAVGLASIAAIIAVVVGIRRHQPVNRRFWSLIAVSLVAGVVSGVLATVLPKGETTGLLVDLSFLAGYSLFVLAAVWVLPRRGAERDWASLLDSLTIALAVGLLFWYFAVSRALASDLSTHTLVSGVIWPVYDLTLAIVVSRLVMSGARRDFPLFMVTIMITAGILTDFWYAVTATTGGYSFGQVSDALWVVPMFAIGAAGLHPAMRDFVSVPGAVRLRMTWGRTFSVGLVTFAVPIGLCAKALADGTLEEHVPALLVFGSLLVLANLGRTGEMLRHAHKLAGDLKVINNRLVQALEERAQLNQELHHRAAHDALTGLANRDLLRTRLEEVLGDRRRSSSALMFIDLDDFKALNDTLGHPAGDAALVQVADRVTGLVRAQDLVARLGGDEFAVLVTDVDRGVVEGLATRLIAALGEPLRIGDVTTRLGASVGVAWVDTAESADEAIRDADIAMYRAKAEGKNRFSVFAAEMHERLLARSRAKEALEAALVAGEVDVAYQPVVFLADGSVEGVEALVRWAPADGTRVSALELVRLAEETGLITTLGRYVLARAAAQVRAWRALGIRLNLAVNVSSQQLADPEFGPAVLAALRQFGPGQSLVLEITESSIVLGQSSEIALLESLRSHGCRIAVDDFGTGFSSLAYLKRLPIDIVKLDKLFVGGIDGGMEEASVARAIISMSHALGYRVVAEGVERAAEAQTLRELGCELAQGYLYSRPVPPDDIAAMFGMLHPETRLPLAGGAGGSVQHVGVLRAMGETQA